MRWITRRRLRRRPSKPANKRPEERPSPGQDYQRHVPRTRLLILLGAMGILFAILLTGMAYQQLFQFNTHREKEARQNYRRILLPGPRGNVYDRDGRLMVGNRPVFNAVVSLNELRPEFRAEYRKRAAAKNAIQQRLDRASLNIESRSAVVQRYLNRLNQLLGTSHVVNSNGLERHFRRSLLLPYTLVDDLTPEDYALLIEQIPVESPIQVITDSARYYPHGKAACHVLGFVSNTDQLNAEDIPGEDLLTFHFEGKVGRSGIERVYDEDLQGRSGGEVWSVDPGGYQHALIAQRSPIQGNDLVTTIDLDLQLAAERGLSGKSGALAAIDIATGEVLAMASLPNYDLNDLTPFLSYEVDERIREEGGWLNRAAQGLYPPGSTFKIVTATAAMREGVVDASTVIECPGYFLVGRRTFRCHRHSGHGPETLEEAIRDSCNVFFYDRSAEMGASPIIEEARRFGFDEPTGIKLFGETRGMHVPDAQWKKERTGEGWYGGDTANLSIGQGYLLSTPLQIACFAASIARGETRTLPILIKENASRNGVSQNAEPIGLPFGQYERILQGMKDAGSVGTARLAALNTGVTVAGKTGTAQVRKDGKPTTIAWYMGFAPADDPKIAIAVAIEGVPEESSIGGGADAAPVAAEVFRTYFSKMGPTPQTNSQF